MKLYMIKKYLFDQNAAVLLNFGISILIHLMRGRHFFSEVGGGIQYKSEKETALPCAKNGKYYMGSLIDTKGYKDDSLPIHRGICSENRQVR